jgi:hypothetical protein
MIQDNTPSKLREIIMDTWPQLYWLKKDSKVNKNGSINTTTNKEGMVRCPG